MRYFILQHNSVINNNNIHSTTLNSVEAIKEPRHRSLQVLFLLFRSYSFFCVCGAKWDHWWRVRRTKVGGNGDYITEELGNPKSTPSRMLYPLMAEKQTTVEVENFSTNFPPQFNPENAGEEVTRIRHNTSRRYKHCFPLFPHSFCRTDCRWGNHEMLAEGNWRKIRWKIVFLLLELRCFPLGKYIVIKIKRWEKAR